jgi:hypothetical protein
LIEKEDQMHNFIRDVFLTKGFYKKPMFWGLVAAVIVPFGFVLVPALIIMWNGRNEKA